MHQRDTGHGSHDVATTRPWDRCDETQEQDTRGGGGCIAGGSLSAAWHALLLGIAVLLEMIFVGFCFLEGGHSGRWRALEQ